MNFQLKKNYDPKTIEKTYTFYQICQFSFEGLYYVRKIIFNNKYNIIKYTEKGLKKEVLDNFIKNARLNKFNMYPYYILKNIPLPDDGTLSLAMSEMLYDNN